MNITVLYFGSLRAQRDLAEERIHTSATTVSELYTELQSEHDLKLTIDQLRTARNEDFCPPETILKENDTIALMPPMAGG